MSFGTKKSTWDLKVEHQNFPWNQKFANSSATNLSATGSSKSTVLPSGESPLTLQPGTNIILLGEAGVGKSSVINLIAQEKVAKVSSGANGCTMESTPYKITFDDMEYTIFDTIGLEQPKMGMVDHLTAIEKAFELIKNLEAAGGIHLLLFCMRGGRLTTTARNNYHIFYEFLCDKRVPIALVFTGHWERNVEDWWERNKDHIAYYGIRSHGHACITAVHDDTEEEVAKYKDSQKKIRDLIKDCALQSAALLPEPDSWFAGFARGLMGLTEKHQHPGKKTLVKMLTRRRGLAPDVAEKTVNMMRKVGPEPNENEWNPGISSQGVEASSKTAVDGDPPKGQGGDEPSQRRTDGEMDAEERAGNVSEGTMEGKNVTTDDGVSISQVGAKSLLCRAGNDSVGEQGTFGGRSTLNDIAPPSGAPAVNTSGDSDNIQAKFLPPRLVSESTEPANEQGSGSKLEGKGINTGNARGGGGVLTRLQKAPFSPNAVALKRVATADNASAGSTNEETGTAKNGSGSGKKRTTTGSGVSNSLGKEEVVGGNRPITSDGSTVSSRHPFLLSHAGERTRSASSKEDVQGKSAVVADEHKGSRPQENTWQYGHVSDGRISVSTVLRKNPERYESGSGPGSSKGDKTQPSTDGKTKHPMASSGNNSHRFPVRSDTKGSGINTGNTRGGAGVSKSDVSASYASVSTERTWNVFEDVIQGKPDCRNLTDLVTREGNDPVESGGFAYIYRGTFRQNAECVTVAIKAIKTYSGDKKVTEEKKQKRLRREMKVWFDLQHPNILPLLGTATGFGKYLAMVCPWAENGTLTTYLGDHYDSLSEIEIIGLLNNVASGLHYLHSRSIVHGDLSGSNILIRKDGGAYICDFGLSILLTELAGPTFATSYQARGTLRWVAPELLDLEVPKEGMEDKSPHRAPKMHSDVYSFGRLMLQILSGKIPYHYFNYDGQILHAILKGITPSRPSNVVVTEDRWAFIERCWDIVNGPQRRPSSEEIVEFTEQELTSTR